MKKTSDFIAQTLGEAGILQEEDIASCSYGLETFLTSVLEFISVMALSLVFGNFIETLIFLISFIPIRVYAGGYHADTRIHCYIVLLAVYAVVSVAVRIMPPDIYTAIALVSGILAFIMVISFAPIINSKKSIYAIEAKHYKNISIVIMLIEMLITFIGILAFENNLYLCCFALGQLVAALSMAAALIKKTVRV